MVAIPKNLPLPQLRLVAKKARGRVLASKISFFQATTDVANKNEREAHEKAEMCAVGLEVITVFLLPSLAKFVAKLATRQALALSAFRADFPDKATAFWMCDCLSWAQREEGENVKRSVEAVVKASCGNMKMNSRRLFGDTEVDQFLKALRDQFSHEVQNIHDRLVDLRGLPDAYIAATYFAFDADGPASEDAFVEVIEDNVQKYKSQVEIIGKTLKIYGKAGSKTTETKAAWIYYTSGPGHIHPKRVALIRETSEAGQITREFIEWVDPAIESFALGKTQAIFGSVDNFSRDAAGAP